MKKFSLFISLFVCLLMISTKSYSQNANWEAGMRFGDNLSVDLTIPVGTDPRLHTAVYLDRFGIGGYFDWMFALSDGPAGLKFYPGVGPEVFFGGEFDLGVAGDFGVEYSFDFPLTLGIDWRPSLIVTGGDFTASNWGFLARFRFGEGTTFRRTR